MHSPDSAFVAELARWGPGGGAPAPGLREAEAYCRRLARTHYENFPIASCLLPRRLHQPFFNVYAYCRWADDLGDELGDPARSLAALDWWRQELNACYSGHGQARHPVFVALAPTVRQFGIPRQPFEDLIQAFEQDQRITDYETFPQLLDYCRRSANPVGRIVLYLGEAFNEQNAWWSDATCTGLQLTNFWQDVARDLDLGRIYLPREDCSRFGYPREALRARVTNQAFLDVMRYAVNRARGFLHCGLALTGRLPARLGVDVELFGRGGLLVLDRIERSGYRVWDQRPVIRRRDFSKLFAGVAWRTLVRRSGFLQPK